MQIAEKTAVTIHYTLKNDEGEVLDTSREREPLNYLQGAGNIVPGLEKQLEGKGPGDKLEVTLAPEDAYGVRDEKNVRNVPLRKIKVEGRAVAPGMHCQVQVPDGYQMALVKTVQGDYATVDLNHPLAGMRLHFEVEVVSVRAANAEELKHGHVHGPGGHHG
jgi:FKBP-type peptidyl-prolyl cis-trans isomerase SlyD